MRLIAHIFPWILYVLEVANSVQTYTKNSNGTFKRQLRYSLQQLHPADKEHEGWAYRSHRNKLPPPTHRVHCREQYKNRHSQQHWYTADVPQLACGDIKRAWQSGDIAWKITQKSLASHPASVGTRVRNGRYACSYRPSPVFVSVVTRRLVGISAGQTHQI